ncbi:MAG: hypothetical protein JWM04_946, partial [Verrucomicrobiales bacterium]|nr:hypothetical protein [Verrucomicrobiales bacterium]
MINPFDLIQKVSLKKWIVLLALSLPFAIPGHGADLLSESDLYDGVLQEIRSTLNGPNQLGLLPDNILSIAVSNDREPVFSLRPLVMAPTKNLSEAIASFQIDRGGFRLVRGGDVIALGPSQVILASSYTGASRTLAILDPSTVFYSNYSNKFHPHLPFWNRTDWGFRIDGGIALNSAPEHEPDILVDHENVVVVPGPEETVFLVRSNHYAGNSVTRYLKIITQNKEALKTEVYTNLPTGDAIHPIRLKDGKWLLLGQKFLTAEDSLPAKVEDARLEQLLAAFEKGDNKTFLPLLEFVTQYPNPNLDGFIRLLNQKKDPAARLQELESIGNSALQGLEKLNSQPVNKPALANATAEQITNTLQFLDEVEQLRSAGNGISASNLRTALSSGFQYFDGWWIHNPYILHTENFQSAIVYSQYLDRKFDRHYGIFRVDDNRRLSLLGKVDLFSSVNYSDIRDASRSPASYQYCRSGTGEEYIFVANEGLGLLTNGKIQWLQSDEFRQMSQLIGSDRHGHLYFGSRPANANLENTVIARNPGHCWVLQPNKPARKAKEVVLLSIGSAPLLDSTNRIWFMAGPRPRYAGMPMNTSLNGDTSTLRGR